MDPEMRKEIDGLMETWALSARSASHWSDRLKLLDFFIRWYKQGVTVSAADWEAYLNERGWDDHHRRAVVDMPSDVRHIARAFGH